MDKIYKEAYNQAIKSLERYARKIAKQNESLFEELIGEANMGISELLSQYNPSKGTLKTYMINSGKWQMLRYLKKEVEMGLHPVFLSEEENIEDFPDETDQEEAITIDIDVNLLLAELNQLDERKATIIKLYYLEQKPFREVGECLNISTERAKQILREAVMDLKSLVRKNRIKRMKNHK